jgi:hypothetical protein
LLHRFLAFSLRDAWLAFLGKFTGSGGFMALWNQTTAEDNQEKPTVVPAAAPQATAIPVGKDGVSRGHRESVLGAGVTLEGRIEGDADVRIAGKVKGEIQIRGDLVVDRGARITAKVSAANVTLGGELDGPSSPRGRSSSWSPVR